MNGQSSNPSAPSSTSIPSGDASNANGVLGAGPSNGEHTIDTAGGRILCIADIRGKISRLNELAERHNAKAIIHTGDFGFYDKDSVERITDRTLRHIVQYSSLIEPHVREKYFPLQVNPKDPSRTPLSLGQLREALINPSPEQVAEQHGQDFILSEFPKLLKGEISLRVPVYTIWGACEDVHILEKIRLATDSTSSSSSTSGPSASGRSEYAIPNLTVLSEGVTRLLNIGGVKLRLFGLGGSLVYHKLFDNGEGNATIAGGNGTMWTTTLQIGELVDTAQRVFDPSETRLLITHASVGREGLLAQLALAIKADFTISASLHFRYSTSYNDFATQTNTESFRNKFVVANKSFMEVYESVKTQVEGVIDDQQKKLLAKALGVANRLPSETGEEAAWKNSWHWNLPDALYGTLLLDIREGRVGSEMRSTGFNFAYRLSGNKQAPPQTNSHHHQQQQQQQQQNSNAASAQAGPSKRSGQVPFQQRQVPTGNAGPASSTPQEPSKQGYMGRTAPAEQATASSTTTATAPSGSAAADRTGAGTPPVSRAPPTPRDFENLASIAFKKPVGHTGPHAGVAPGPGAGRGRGTAPLKDYVVGGHKKASSSATSSPAEPATGVKKDDAAVKPEATADAATDNAAKTSEGAQNSEAGQQRRTSGFGARPRSQRDDSANWRDRVSQDDKAQQVQSQSEASGNESPAGGSSFRGRGRGRGQFDPTRGRGGAHMEGGGFRGGRGGPHRGSFDGGRGGGVGGRGSRGGHRGGRGSFGGGNGETSAGESQGAAPSGAASNALAPKSASPAPEKPKAVAPESSA